MTEEAAAPWFTDREGSLLLFKVNRRPLSRQKSLFEEERGFLDHVVEVLPFGGEPVLTGRKYRRAWHLGNRNIDLGRGLVSGQVGWARSDRLARDEYLDEEAEWIDSVDTRTATARAPFGIDAETQQLVVVAHPTFTHRNIAHVFTALLNRGEGARAFSSTEWDVEPYLDESSFESWIREVDAVERVRFVAKLPNPDSIENLEPVFKRLETLKAKQIIEVIEAGDEDVGLKNLREDPTTAAFLGMAENAYGYVTARGRREGNETNYDQRVRARRQYLGPLPQTWSELMQIVVEFLLERRKHDH